VRGLYGLRSIPQRLHQQLENAALDGDVADDFMVGERGPRFQSPINDT
jgi:hypothetical protein